MDYLLIDLPVMAITKSKEIITWISANDELCVLIVLAGLFFLKFLNRDFLMLRSRR